MLLAPCSQRVLLKFCLPPSLAGLAGQTGRPHTRKDLLQRLRAGHVGALLENFQLVSDLLHPQLDVAESRFREGVTLVLHSRGELVVQADLSPAGRVLLYNVI